MMQMRTHTCGELRLADAGKSVKIVGWMENVREVGSNFAFVVLRDFYGTTQVVIESEEQLNSAFARFKALADKKHEIFDEDLQALMSDESSEPKEHFRLLSAAFHSETGEEPSARVTLSVGNKEENVQSSGSGPVDAAFKAIEGIAKSGAQLLLYSVNAITTGTDAQGEVTVRLSKDGRVVNGQGADTDIIVASAKAYLNALNKLQSNIERVNPQV